MESILEKSQLKLNDDINLRMKNIIDCIPIVGYVDKEGKTRLSKEEYDEWD